MVLNFHHMKDSVLKQMYMSRMCYFAFCEMIENHSLTFEQAIGNIIDIEEIKTNKPSKQIASEVLKYSLSQVLVQALVFQNEAFKHYHLDEALTDSKSFLNRVREKLSVKNIGNKQLYKLIREAIVHNNPEDPNVVIDEKLHLTFRFKQKNAQDIKIELNLMDVAQVVNVFNLNLDNTAKQITVYEKDFADAISNHQLTDKNLDKFVQAKINGQDVIFDQFQKSAYVNFAYKTNEIYETWYGISPANWQIVSGHLPFKENFDNLFLDNYKLVNLFLFLMQNTNKNIQQLLEDFYHYNKNNNLPAREFLIGNLFYDVCFNTILSNVFTLVNSTSQEEIKHMFELAGYTFSNEEIRHLRNAFAHGRYFYNYAKQTAVEIYDGQNEIEHVGTFSVDELFDLINSVLENNIEKCLV